MKNLIAVGLALMLAASCSQSAADVPMADQWVAVTLTSEPVELGVAETGRLRFRGGLVLSAPEEMFGGISGLEVLDDGRLIAITDSGYWLEAYLELDEAGALAGVTRARMAFMRDERAQPFPSKEAGDAEALTQLPDGRFAVAFEQTQTIRIYDLNRDGPFGAAQHGPPLAGVDRLFPNAGLEALAADESGALIVGAEGGGGPTQIWRAPLDAAAPAPVVTHYAPARGFSLTGLDRMPGGGFVALERFYAPIIGARARITQFASLDGARIAAQELALLAPPMPVDNFEGVAAVRMGEATRIYIVSDNNFSSRQRTLLLAFDLIEGDVAN